VSPSVAALAFVRRERLLSLPIALFPNANFSSEQWLMESRNSLAEIKMPNQIPEGHCVPGSIGQFVLIAAKIAENRNRTLVLFRAKYSRKGPGYEIPVFGQKSQSGAIETAKQKSVRYRLL